MSTFDTRTSAMIFLTGAFLYGLSMPRQITFEDAGLFLQVCHFGGIAHPPGYPLFTLLCTPLFEWLPVDPVLLGNSISAFFGALTAVVFYLLLNQIGISRRYAGLGAVLLLIAEGFWSQAVIIEVYTLNSFLSLICFYFAVRFHQSGQTRYLQLLVFFFSLGLANHWPLMILSLVGMLVILSSRTNEIVALLRSPGFLLSCLILSLTGLAPYLWLILSTPEFSYSGPVNGPAEFLAYFFRHAYAGVDQQAVADLNDTINYMRWSLLWVATQDGAWFLLFAIPGAMFGQRIWGRSIQAGLIAILLSHTLLLSWLLGFDFDYFYQAVMSAYLLIGHISFLILTVAGIQLTARFLDKRHSFAALYVLLIAFTAATLYSNAERGFRANDMIASRYAATVLSSLDQDAILVTSADSQTFPIGYLHNVTGVRQDVTLYHAKNLFFQAKFDGSEPADYQRSLNRLGETRPVYFIGVNWLSKGTDYGIYSRLSSSSAAEFALNSSLNKFVSNIADLYITGRIHQPHDLYFCHQLLYDASLQLIGYTSQATLPDTELQLLLKLQTTFPGTLATLATALSNSRFNPSSDLLLSLAKPHINNTPVESDNFQESQFYYYLSLLESDTIKAHHYLSMSAEIYPADNNPGFVTWSGT